MLQNNAVQGEFMNIQYSHGVQCITHKLIKEVFWIRRDFASFIRILLFSSLFRPEINKC